MLFAVWPESGNRGISEHPEAAARDRLDWVDLTHWALALVTSPPTAALERGMGQQAAKRRRSPSAFARREAAVRLADRRARHSTVRQPFAIVSNGSESRSAPREGGNQSTQNVRKSGAV